jgi:NAD(P)-dependent dehydrogenase (short-subunit alcohol dehydrogenase family)
MKINQYDLIVTGAAGKIGADLVGHLSSKGLKVKGVDLAYGNNLSDEDEVKELFRLNKAKSIINLFAMNEHISGSNTLAKNIWEFNLYDIERYMKVNITDLFSVCRAFAKDNPGSSIVNFSSIYGVRPPQADLYDGSYKHIGYSVSKAGVLALSEYLALALAPDIRVNTIVPGGIFANQPEAFLKKYAKKCPMGRMAEVSDLYGIIDFLISDSSKYTTGATFVIDGGWTI